MGIVPCKFNPCYEVILMHTAFQIYKRTVNWLCLQHSQYEEIYNFLEPAVS